MCVRSPPCLKENLLFFFIIFFFNLVVCLGFTQVSGCLLPRLRCRHLSRHKSLCCGTQLSWSIPVSLLRKYTDTYMSVCLHTNLWVAPFHVLCSVLEHPSLLRSWQILKSLCLVTAAPLLSALTYFLPSKFCLLLLTTYLTWKSFRLYSSSSSLVKYGDKGVGFLLRKDVNM